MTPRWLKRLGCKWSGHSWKYWGRRRRCLSCGKEQELTDTRNGTTWRTYL